MSFLASPFAFIIVGIVGMLVVQVVKTVTAGTKDIVMHRNELELKQRLVDRGFSPDEIERIIRTSAIQSAEELPSDAARLRAS